MIGRGLMAGAIERQRADVHGLAWLIDRLLGGEQYGGLRFDADRLRVVGIS